MSDTPEALIADIRDLIEAARTAELTDVELAPIRAAVQAATDDLRPHFVDDVRMQAVLDFSHLISDMPDEEGRIDRLREKGPAWFFAYSPYCGALNPVSPPIEVELHDADDGIEVRGHCVFRDQFNGPPASVHGGVIAAVIDDILGTVCVVNDVGGFTGTLTIRYRRPTPLQKRIDIRAWVSGREGRKTFAAATFHHDGELLAEGDGIFIAGSMEPRV